MTVQSTCAVDTGMHGLTSSRKVTNDDSSDMDVDTEKVSRVSNRVYYS